MDSRCLQDDDLVAFWLPCRRRAGTAKPKIVNPEITVKEKAPRSEDRGAQGWRWGELNPRPMSCCQGFSGRSLHRIFSAPAMLQTAG